MGGVMEKYIAPAVLDYFVFDNSENKITFGVVNSMELIVVEQ
jgi:hypothetical protein